MIFLFSFLGQDLSVELYLLLVSMSQIGAPYLEPRHHPTRHFQLSIATKMLFGATNLVIF